MSHECRVPTNRQGSPIDHDHEVDHDVDHDLDQRRARRAVAFGTFTATGRIGNEPAATYTRARLFQAEGGATPLTMRFSAVTGSGDTSDAARGPRGFALRFATADGPWDLAGSNLPVSFVRDAGTFTEVIGHDARRIVDVMADTPGSMHLLLFLFSPRGIPTDHRHQQGFGLGTSAMVAANGRSVLVRYHFHPRQGVACLTASEAAAVRARERDHASRDLAEAIEAGDYPEWDLFVQLMDDDEQPGLDFDPLDHTRVWPEDRFPLRHVGTLQLDGNAGDLDAGAEPVDFGTGVVDGLVPVGRPPVEGGDHPGDGHHPGSGDHRGSDYAQPADRWRTMTDFERDDLVANLVALLAGCAPATRARMVWHLLLVDDDLGNRVGAGLGIGAHDVAGLAPLSHRPLTDEDRQRLARLGRAGPRTPGAGKVTGSVPVRRLAETPASRAHRLATP